MPNKNIIYSNLPPMCNSTTKTQLFEINNIGRYMPYIKYFKYLGSIIDFMLNNLIDVKIYVKSVNKVIGVMGFI